MILDLRRRSAELLTGGGQLLLLAFGVHTESRAGMGVSLLGIALLSFFAWISSVRRWRAVGDTPTSHVASAAQGYVELAGRARNHEAAKVIAPHSQLPCCWYRYLVEKRDTEKKRWSFHDDGESVESFELVDATGACTIEPEGAEVLTRSKETWTSGDYRYTEWLIIDGDPLYVLGEFSTRRVAPGAIEARRDQSALLAAWKDDKPELLRRFDLNGDGQVDFNEWMLARAEAKRQIDRVYGDLRNAPAFDVVAKPSDGRLFVLSNLDPAKLERQYYIRAWVHVALIFVGLGAGLWLLV